MSKRTMRVILDVVVEDLSAAERAECSEGLVFDDDDDDGSELPALADDEFTATDFADLISGFLQPEVAAEMFAGSGMYAQFASASLVSAEWTTELEGERP